MYLKLITCEVNTNKRIAFSKAQEEWNATAISDGFITQIGGWNENNKNEAIIVAFWENKTHLDYFMENIHDTIFNTNNHEDTYNSITINHFSSNENDLKFFIESMKKVDYLCLSGYESNNKVNDSELIQSNEISLDFNWKNIFTILIGNNQKQLKKESGRILIKRIKLLDVWSVFPLSNN